MTRHLSQRVFEVIQPHIQTISSYLNLNEDDDSAVKAVEHILEVHCFHCQLCLEPQALASEQDWLVQYLNIIMKGM